MVERKRGTIVARKPSLVMQVTGQLREQLSGSEVKVGTRLPTEAMLAAEFGVSRPTVRAALRELENLGLVHTKHGVGSFVTKPPAVQAGLERMDSITDSIRQGGKEPGMNYMSRHWRQVLPEEGSRMGVRGDVRVLELRRTILADGEVVAYSYDLIPADLLPEGFDPEELDGSLFAFFSSRLGISAVRGQAEVHAVHSAHIGWGREAAAHDLFVLLDQVHYTADSRVLMYSRTYFIEGRYNFTIQRTRL